MALRRPTIVTLLGHVLKSVFTTEVLWITAPGGAIVGFLYLTGIALDKLLVALIGAVVVLAFLRGCRAWQRDLAFYRRSQSSQRHRQAG